MTDEPVLMEIAMPARADEVWNAVRDPAVLRRWFGWDHEGLDDEIHTIFVGETSADEDARTLEIGGHLFALDDQGPVTLVRVTRNGPAVDEIDEGWLSFLQQLRFVLARHRDDTRRTIHRSGPAPRAEAPAVEDALGLGEVARLPPGERYEATTAVGDVISGEVWFRSERQLGLTVDAWGDGLLLVTSSPSMFLCTYGLDAAAMADLEERWGCWWDAYLTSGD